MTREFNITTFHNALINERRDDLDGWHLAGWSSFQSQQERFKTLVRNLHYKGGSVIDFGCGTGELYLFLKKLGLPFNYIGLDCNPEMLKIARSRYGDRFQLIKMDDVPFENVDYVFLSGVFQFLDVQSPNYHLTLCQKVFSKCKLGMAVNFLSIMRKESAKIQSELYVDPIDIISFAKKNSHFWSLDHSYHTIGGDMTLTLLHQNLDEKWERPASQ